jgi:hypothetical protein
MQQREAFVEVDVCSAADVSVGQLAYEGAAGDASPLKMEQDSLSADAERVGRLLGGRAVNVGLDELINLDRFEAALVLRRRSADDDLRLRTSEHPRQSLQRSADEVGLFRKSSLHGHVLGSTQPVASFPLVRPAAVARETIFARRTYRCIRVHHKSRLDAVHLQCGGMSDGVVNNPRSGPPDLMPFRW